MDNNKRKISKCRHDWNWRGGGEGRGWAGFDSVIFLIPDGGNIVDVF